ncbi:MAG: DUF1521 domain-containing protein, partial [Myxococcota bacterium]
GPDPDRPPRRQPPGPDPDRPPRREPPRRTPDPPKKRPPITRIWGDPHVDENADGKDDWHFGKDSTFILPDGTKICLDTEPNEAGEWFVVAADVIGGGDRFHYGGGGSGELTGDGAEFDRAHADAAADPTAGVFALQDNGEWAARGEDGAFYDIQAETWEQYGADRDVDLGQRVAVAGGGPSGGLSVPEKRPDCLTHADSAYVETAGGYCVELLDTEVIIYGSDGRMPARSGPEPEAPAVSPGAGRFARLQESHGNTFARERAAEHAKAPEAPAKRAWASAGWWD